jgi:hypothetical protein
MKTPTAQTFLAFEQTIVDAEHAAEAARLHAKEAARVQRAILKKKAEMDKSNRRMFRHQAWKEKQPDQVAVCGINFYTLSPRERNRGCYWTHCHRCGKALRYFDSYAEAEANNGECKRSE